MPVFPLSPSTSAHDGSALLQPLLRCSLEGRSAPTGCQKRPPRCPHLRGLHVPSFDAPSPSSWCSRVRSRRTVRRGSGDRSGFGCPQAIRKGTVRQRFPNDPCCSLRTPVKLFVLWVLHFLSPPIMWSNSPSRHELPLLHAFGRSEGLFGSPPRCRYY